MDAPRTRADGPNPAMPLGHTATGRTTTEWVIRGGLALLALGLGSLGVTGTAGSVMRSHDPESALVWASEGRTKGAVAKQLITAATSAADRKRSVDLARAALGSDPTAISAVWALGVNAQIAGDIAGARRLFAYAQRLSRRDLDTQLWAIEDAVGRGDVGGALRHYDIALRISKQAAPLLFPVLLSALSDPPVQVQLARILADQPPWGGGFINFVVEASADPRLTAQIFSTFRSNGVGISDPASSALIDKLFTENHASDAWAYYRVIRSSVNQRQSRDPAFTADSEVPTVFDWKTVEDSIASTVIVHEGDTHYLEFTVPSGTDAALVRQAQVLPTGNYRLEGRSTGIDQPEGSRPYWTIACSDGRELARVDLPDASQAEGAFSGRFTIPAGCSTQMLTLTAPATQNAAGTTGKITLARIIPA